MSYIKKNVKNTLNLSIIELFKLVWIYKVIRHYLCTPIYCKSSHSKREWHWSFSKWHTS